MLMLVLHDLSPPSPLPSPLGVDNGFLIKEYTSEKFHEWIVAHVQPSITPTSDDGNAPLSVVAVSKPVKDYYPSQPLRDAEQVPVAVQGLRDDDNAYKLMRVNDAWVSVRFAFDKQVGNSGGIGIKG